MIRDFGIAWDHRDLFIEGFVSTLWLSALATVLSLTLGAAIASVLMSRAAAARRAAQWLVDGFRCIPFLLLAYLVYYGLPSLGVRLDNWSSGLLALVIYNAAYMAEILRGAWAALPREYEEAAHAFGFTGLTLYRRIILPPVVLAAVPVIGNQVIQIIKDTAFLMIIAVPELTHSASSVQSTYYIPFAAFVTAVALYWVLCATVELAVSRIEIFAEARR
jgi:polar amino acid transport system permease protein